MTVKMYLQQIMFEMLGKYAVYIGNITRFAFRIRIVTGDTFK